MWRKAKSTGSLFIQNVDSVIGTSDHSANDIWNRRLKRRIQSGEFGITLQTVLPKKLIPLPWQRQMVVKQAQDTLSSLSLDGTVESSEDLIRCSTLGLIDPTSLQLVAESLKTPRMSSENDLSYSFEEFVKSEHLLLGDKILLEELDLSKEFLDQDQEEAHASLHTEDTYRGNPGFLSAVDITTDLEKWKGERHHVEDINGDDCQAGPAEDLQKADGTTPNDIDGQTSSYESSTIETTPSNSVHNTPGHCGQSKLPDAKQVDSENGKTDVEFQHPMAYSINTNAHLKATGTNDSKQNQNNSGKEVVKRFVNKVSPEILDTNNHSMKESKQNKFVGVANLAYQSHGVSKESVRSQKINWTQPNTTITQNTEKANLQLKKENSFLKGGDGYKHYRLFAMVENAVNIKRMEIMKKNLLEDYRWRQNIVDELVEVARAYYLNPTGPSRKRWKELRQEIDQHSMYSLTDTRAKLAAVSHFKPVATYIIIMFQVLMFSIMVCMGGLATVDVASRLKLQDNTRTYLGTETVDTWHKVNMWIGPTSSFLIDMGSILGICMRDDHNLYMMGVAQNFSSSDTLGCCEIHARNTAGTTTPEECHTLTLGVGQWRNVTCNQRESGDNSVQHVLKPCCVDNAGTCALLSNEHCTFLGGVFHERNKEHCSQVNCPSEICKMGGMSSNPDKPWLPASYQWWRPLVSLVYTHGFMHLVLVVMAEWLLMCQVEMSAGWLRVVIIYTLCGVAGGMCASVFSPYSPQVGTTAAVMGSLGIIHMELIEGWKLITKPWQELVKIYSLLAFAIFSGTLPHVSNAAIITGFLTGLLTAVAFLPYINLGCWTKRSRRAVVISSLFLLFLLFFLIIYSFHKIQSLHLCQWCKIFDCVNFADNMCSYT